MSGTDDASVTGRERDVKEFMVRLVRDLDGAVGYAYSMAGQPAENAQVMLTNLYGELQRIRDAVKNKATLLGAFVRSNAEIRAEKIKRRDRARSTPRVLLVLPPTDFVIRTARPTSRRTHSPEVAMPDLNKWKGMRVVSIEKIDHDLDFYWPEEREAKPVEAVVKKTAPLPQEGPAFPALPAKKLTPREMERALVDRGFVWNPRLGQWRRQMEPGRTTFLRESHIRRMKPEQRRASIQCIDDDIRDTARKNAR